MHDVIYAVGPSSIFVLLFCITSFVSLSLFLSFFVDCLSHYDGDRFASTRPTRK